MSAGFDKAGLPMAAVGVRPNEDALPASHAQERMWFFERLDGATPAYNIPAALQLRGALAPPTLRAALGDTISRHECLRTRFLEIDGQLMQVVSPVGPCVELPVIDLATGRDSSGGASEALSARLAADANTPFDLCAGAPIRFSLFRLHEQLHVLYACMHHIVADGWSIGILIREVAARYAARLSGARVHFDELPIQYADYAAWQRERVARTPETASAPAYWRESLTGLPPALDLPTDAPRPRKLSGRGGWHVTTLDGALGERLKAVSRAHGVTPFMMVLSVFALFLMRIGCQRDLGVGTTLAERTQPQTHPLIGLFVNTIVLRLRADGDPPFGVWLQQVKDVCVRGYAHQDWPFDRVVAALRPERSLACLPLFQVMFSMQGVPRTDIAMPGLTVERIPVTTDASKFDLALDAEETDGGLTLSWEYSTDLFDATTIAHWAASFACLLEAALRDPRQSLSALPMLPEATRADTDIGDCDVRFAGARHDTFDARFRRICRASPDAIAVEDDARTLSYGALDALSAHIAQALHACGARAGESVGCCLEPGVRVPAALLGILKAGCACVPLTPERAAARIRELAEADRPGWLLVDAQTESQCASLGVHILRIDDRLRGACPVDAVADTYGVTEAGADAKSVSPANARADQTACWARSARARTDGPPNVAITHRNLCAASDAWQTVLASDAASARWMQITDVDSGAFVADLLRTLGTGGTMVMGASPALIDAKSLTGWLLSRRIDAAAFAPAVLRELTRYWERADVSVGLPRVLVVEAATGHWHGADQARVRAALGAATRVILAYGTAETTFCGGFDEPSNGSVAGWMPIGRALPGGRLLVLDDARRPIPVGAIGDLCVGGAAVAAADYCAADADRTRGSGFYRTGDRARMRADGAIELVCGPSDTLVLRGWRIPRGRVEDALLRLPGVRHAEVAIGEPKPGEQSLFTYVVIDGDEWVPRAMCNELRLVLPEHMVPSVWVRLDALTRIEGCELVLRPRSAPEPAPTSAHEVGAGAPDTRTERLLAQHWGELLGVTESLSASDDFFGVGGDSLLAMRLVSRLRRACGIDLPVSVVFDTPTLRALANRIDSLSSRGLSDAN